MDLPGLHRNEAYRGQVDGFSVRVLGGSATSLSGILCVGRALDGHRGGTTRYETAFTLALSLWTTRLGVRSRAVA